MLHLVCSTLRAARCAAHRKTTALRRALQRALLLTLEAAAAAGLSSAARLPPCSPAGLSSAARLPPCSAAGLPSGRATELRRSSAAGLPPCSAARLPSPAGIPSESASAPLAGVRSRSIGYSEYHARGSGNGGSSKRARVIMHAQGRARTHRAHTIMSLLTARRTLTVIQEYSLAARTRARTLWMRSRSAESALCLAAVARACWLSPVPTRSAARVPPAAAVPLRCVEHSQLSRAILCERHAAATRGWIAVQELSQCKPGVGRERPWLGPWKPGVGRDWTRSVCAASL